MLSEEDIKKAESQVRMYLEDGKLTKVTPKQHILDIFVKNAILSIFFHLVLFSESLTQYL